MVRRHGNSYHSSRKTTDHSAIIATADPVIDEHPQTDIRASPSGIEDGVQLAKHRTFPPGYWMMTRFMLQGVRVKVRGRLCAPMLVVFGGAHVLIPAGSGGVPVGEPDRS
jgi:hypothetical protein